MFQNIILFFQTTFLSLKQPNILVVFTADKQQNSSLFQIKFVKIKCHLQGKTYQEFEFNSTNAQTKNKNTFVQILT